MMHIRLFAFILAVLLTACTEQIVIIPNDLPVAISTSSSSISSTMVASVSSQSSIAASVTRQQSSKASLPITEAQWREKLTADQYAVLRENGTEQPYTSDLLNEHRAGTYITADCGDPVFRSEQKFDSGTGWPSFWAPISPDAVMEVSDTTYGMQRTEIQSRCGGHLGHVFTDGPEPTGLRYCMNGVALKFIPDAVQPSLQRDI